MIKKNRGWFISALMIVISFIMPTINAMPRPQAQRTPTQQLPAQNPLQEVDLIATNLAKIERKTAFYTIIKSCKKTLETEA